MHPRVYQEFEALCSKRQLAGAVLEIGAMPSNASLLCMKSLASATDKLGINLDGPHEFRDFRIIQGNANSMDCFANDRFDAVLCNAVLEHDRYFWQTISEIRRITRPGGSIVLGAPGYRYYKLEKVKWALQKVRLLRILKRHPYLNVLFTATVTYEVHAAPGDYYRFSSQAFRDVLLEGLEQIEIREIMMPPRIIGVGTKRVV